MNTIDENVWFNSTTSLIKVEQFDLEALNSFLNEYAYNFIVSIAAALCVVTNGINGAIFSSKKMKYPSYGYLLWKSIFEMLIGLDLMFGWIIFCECSFSQSFLRQIYLIYCFSFGYYALFTATTFAEIAIAYDRLMILQNRVALLDP